VSPVVTEITLDGLLIWSHWLLNKNGGRSRRTTNSSHTYWLYHTFSAKFQQQYWSVWPFLLIWIWTLEEFEDTKGVIVNGKSKKDRQYNDRKKNYKRKNNDLQNITVNTHVLSDVTWSVTYYHSWFTKMIVYVSFYLSLLEVSTCRSSWRCLSFHFRFLFLEFLSPNTFCDAIIKKNVEGS
jgi:hypothetical protein